MVDARMRAALLEALPLSPVWLLLFLMHVCVFSPQASGLEWPRMEDCSQQRTCRIFHNNCPGKTRHVSPQGLLGNWPFDLQVQPTPVFLLGESQGRGAWWAAVYGVAQSRTRLKQLSSSSNLRYKKKKTLLSLQGLRSFKK